MQPSGNQQRSAKYPNEQVFHQGLALTHNDQDPGYAQADWDATEPALMTHRLAVAPALLQHAETLATTNSENAATQCLFPKLGYRFAGEITLAFRLGLRFFCYETRPT